MATAADAARQFATGPQVLEAGRILLNSFSLVALCEALVNARSEDAEHLVTTLGRLADFQEMHHLFLADDVVAFLHQAPQSPDPQIRLVVAKLLKRLAEGPEANTSMLVSKGLLDLCEALVLVEETGTSETAGNVLLAAARWPVGRDAVIGTGSGGSVVERLQGRLTSVGDTQHIRVLHLMVDLGQVSDDAFTSLEKRGAYKAVLGAFLTDDILLKLNAVELMDSLGSFPAGQDLLTRQGIPDQLAVNLIDPMCDDSVLLCVVRLLGFVIRRAPMTLTSLLNSRNTPLAQTIAGLLETTDPTKKLCALNAWANISTTRDGLAFFLDWEGRLQTLVALAGASQNAVCIGAMAAWALVLQDRPRSAAYEVATGTEDAPEARLWDVAEKRLLPLVLRNLTGKPFPDVRFHVWHLLALLMQSQPAAQQIMPSEELRELLLDFKSESNTESKIAKHAFVKALLEHHSHWLGNFLDEKVMDVLEEYAKQGPHWMPRAAAALVGDQAA